MHHHPDPPHDDRDAVPFDRLVVLAELTRLYPNRAAALAAIAGLRAILTLPKETIHVVSDIHGEYKKLKHVVNNASGSLRTLVERTFGDRLDAAEQARLLNLIYYPRETFEVLRGRTGGLPADLLRTTIRLEFELLRELARTCRLDTIERVFPEHFRPLFRELLFAPLLGRGPAFLDTIVDEFVAHGQELDLLRMSARMIRNLLVSELIVAGDLGDRGPRIDRVIEHLMQQPVVSFTWGNHDASWMGACLGHEACIATVLRFSLRYRRLSQLEEGYGITMAPLEKLVRDCYADDPAERFTCRGDGLRDPLLMARMQKAVAVLQFKLEGQLVRRHPDWRLEHRALLHRIDPVAGTVEIEGRVHPLLDTRLPTIDWRDPYALSEPERACMDRLRQSFLSSATMWRQMQFVARRGRMHLRRDHVVIFHGCIPVDEEGRFLPLEVDGVPRAGRQLFDALERVVQRSFRERRPEDLDMLWYLWGGPLSPWFGKDRLATFETYFVADPATHVETKNPYFQLIHERWFCRKVLAEFGLDAPPGLIVNGHVPVRLEKGESPVKASGDAVTIDGAFSEAYGDRGYTLVLEASRTALALHHHFESIDQAIADGADIVPAVTDLRTYPEPRRIGDTEQGDEVRRRIAMLEELTAAFRSGAIAESG